MNYEVIGNAKQLLSMHGDVKVENAIEALKCMSDNPKIDINEINRVSETGGIYVTSDGRILDTFDYLADNKAKYKVVPTGLTLHGTTFPLFASFMKNNNFWEGVYIGTGFQLFEMYKNHYKPADAFSSEYIKIFGDGNRTKDITGFGLGSVIKDVENIYLDEKQEVVYSSSDDTDTANTSTMQAAFANMKDDSTKKSKKEKGSTKASKKLTRLQAHLAKMQQSSKKSDDNQQDNICNNIQEETADLPLDKVDIEVVEQTETVAENCDISSVQTNITDEIQWDATLSLDNERQCQNITELSKSNKPIDSLTYTHEVSNIEQVINDMNHDIPQDVLRYKYEEQSKRNLLKSIYELLMDKYRWSTSGDYKKTLGFYLKGICLVIYEQQNNQTDAVKGGLVLNKDKTKALINTGLLDTFGNYIYLVDNTPDLPNFYDKEINLVYNKTILIDLNFNEDDIKALPMPLDLIQDKSELIFTASVNDFDLEDNLNFSRIIHDRIDRFPSKYRTASAVEICNKIKASIVQSMKIAKSDFRYLIPKYNFYTHEVQWMMPLYLDANVSDKPELVLVIGKNSNSSILSLQTVLNIKDAYDDAQFFGYPNSHWLRA